MSSEDEWFAAACCWIRSEVCWGPLLFCDINGSLFHIDYHFSFEFDMGLWLRFMKGLCYGHRFFGDSCNACSRKNRSKWINIHNRDLVGIEIARIRLLYCLQHLFAVLQSLVIGTAGDAWLFFVKFECELREMENWSQTMHMSLWNLQTHLQLKWDLCTYWRSACLHVGACLICFLL